MFGNRITGALGVRANKLRQVFDYPKTSGAQNGRVFIDRKDLKSFKDIKYLPISDKVGIVGLAITTIVPVVATLGSAGQLVVSAAIAKTRGAEDGAGGSQT